MTSTFCSPAEREFLEAWFAWWKECQEGTAWDVAFKRFMRARNALLRERGLPAPGPKEAA